MDKDALDRGRSFEERFSAATGLTPVPGSGNQWYATEDVEGQSFAFQLKSMKNMTLSGIITLLTRVFLDNLKPGGRGPGTTVGVAIEEADSGEWIIVMRAGDLIEALKSKELVIREKKSRVRRERSRVNLLDRDDDDDELNGRMANGV